MDVTITIQYQTDNEDVNGSVNELLENTLPYMADNVTIDFEIVE